MQRIPIHHESLAEHLSKEWLLTNGLGGFAMASVLGANTRRYHGLLIAATSPPVGRIVALHSLIEQIEIEGRSFDLAAHQFDERAMLHPDGWKRLARFVHSGAGSVTWEWKIDGTVIAKTLRLISGRNAAQISYHVTCGAAPARLLVRPLTPMRDFHALQRESTGGPGVASCDGELMVVRNDQFSLRLSASAALTPTLSQGERERERKTEKEMELRWSVDCQWWRNFAYVEERERGLEWREDVWSPGFVAFATPARERRCFTIEAELIEPHHVAPAVEMSDGALGAAEANDPVRRLRMAADQFIVRRKLDREWSVSIIAGYPWFGDWGRDTMISLPGLMLDLDSLRVGDARAALLTFARHIQNGLIPNLFDDRGGVAHYNTADASLWFIHAVHRLSDFDDALPCELIEACGEIITAYCGGTHFGIALDAQDGLITAGDETTQLTWMDAKRDGVVFTPRFGKAIEINALWHHALRAMIDLVRDRDPRQARELEELARLARHSIQAKFWWPQRQCCHDVLVPQAGAWAPDGKLRPNQIIAVSLPHSPLTRMQQQAVVRTVRQRLLTPFGLRTLDPADPSYRGRFEGDLAQRDAAYHQGTVWPWLIGPYCEAVLRADYFSERARAAVRAAVQPLLGQLDRACIGQIAEVYDGDPPHRPGGCPAQAWSVAELRRAMRLAE